MNKSRKFDGQWRIFGADHPSHIGELSFDPEEGLKLVVKIPQDRTPGETNAAATKAKQERPTVILGFDKDHNPITLIGCRWQKQLFGQGMDVYEISAYFGLIGGHYNSLKDAHFAAVTDQ
jgi:hypothetical protein